MEKRIKLALSAGFCYGVKRAVETVKRIKIDNRNQNVIVLGELIHNSDVIEELNELGIGKVKSVDELKNGDGICVIRSHGASPFEIEEIEKKGYKVLDLTCPDVKKVQQKAIELIKNGYVLIILGKNSHPEVIAIKSNAQRYCKSDEGKIFVIEDLNDLKLIEDKIKKKKKIGVVIQTTQMISLLRVTVDYLLPIVKELKVFNTICGSTSLRQNEAKDIACESDLMVVIGSKKSANTTHLAQVLKDITRTIHIENHLELKKFEREIKRSISIGVTAGASTPEKIINKVIKEIEKY